MECGKLPQKRYEECVSQYDTPYAEYERERQALIKGEKSRDHKVYSAVHGFRDRLKKAPCWVINGNRS